MHSHLTILSLRVLGQGQPLLFGFSTIYSLSSGGSCLRNKDISKLSGLVISLHTHTMVTFHHGVVSLAQEDLYFFW